MLSLRIYINCVAAVGPLLHARNHFVITCNFVATKVAVTNTKCCGVDFVRNLASLITSHLSLPRRTKLRHPPQGRCLIRMCFNNKNQFPPPKNQSGKLHPPPRLSSDCASGAGVTEGLMVGGIGVAEGLTLGEGSSLSSAPYWIWSVKPLQRGGTSSRL